MRKREDNKKCLRVEREGRDSCYVERAREQGLHFETRYTIATSVHNVTQQLHSTKNYDISATFY